MKIKNGIMLLLTAAIWGVAFVAQSVGMEYVEPFTFNAVRSIIGGLVLIPVIFLLNPRAGRKGGAAAPDSWPDEMASEGGRRLASDEVVYEGGRLASDEMASEGGGFPAPDRRLAERRKERETLLAGGIACGVMLCLASNFQQFGVRYTTVGKAGFITACYIVIVPVLGLFQKKKCGLNVWGAVFAAAVGLYLLCMEGDGFFLSKGDGLVFCCAILFSFHILVIDYYAPKTDGVKLSCIQFLVCGILSFLMMLIFEHPVLSDILAAKLPILYAGIMSCGVAYTLQVLGQKGMNPTIASLILSLESSISVLAGWLILGQKLGPRQLIGCGVMFGAIILAQLPIKPSVKSAG